MSVDLRRSRSLSQDLRPRVSFNRDVHVKRYGGKKPLGRIDEEDTEINNMRGRRGKADGTDFNFRRGSVDVDNNTTTSSTTMNSSRKHKENQTFGQRLKSLFGGGGNGGGTKKKQNVSTSTNTETTSTNMDPLRSRYKEYRGEEYETKRRENSTPENKTTWFRSLDRQPKHKNHEKSWTDTTDSRYGGSTRTLRYFGESDTEAMRKPPTKFTGGTLRRNHRFLLDSTSQDDTTDVDTNGRSDSVLYLHTATVGRIPSGTSERSSRFRSENRSEEHEHRRKRTGRTVVRSVSVASPWRPSDPNNRVIHYSSTDRLSNKSHTNSGHREHHRSTEKYGHLVFTGPSFDEQLKNDAYRNDRRRF